MTTAVGSVFGAVLDPVNRHDPYPLLTSLRRTPVSQTPDGTYVVSTFDAITALLHDPRLSSADQEELPEISSSGATADLVGLPPSFLRLDPPAHDRMRRLATRPFGPPHTPHRVADLEPALRELAQSLVSDLPKSTVDIVDQFAYPLPVRVICALLGVPLADEPKFRAWIDEALVAVEPDRAALADLARYLGELVDRRLGPPDDGGHISDRGATDPSESLIARPAPAHGLPGGAAEQTVLSGVGGDLLTALATDDGPDGRMNRAELVSTAMLLLIAGHETTVNLIANSSLVLLRQPLWLERLLDEPGIVVPFIEEVLRYDPPVQMLTWRKALDDIPVAGTTIPKGANITLVLAAGNRDPDQFPDPDRFDPDRTPAQHLGFGDGIHYCFGAPLARLEAQVAVTALAPVLARARLLEDPPVYRLSAVLRGPRHLRVALD
ncbi:cytochrome P450 [Dactylosporangium sp. CS-033363]|uniref:cytochrome P450 n=1 Tax=Dactylosporangium sp. CS-033363 TaxID=3239935 RepID=UPI003D8E9078